MSRRDDIRAAAKGRPRVYVGRGYRRPRLVRALREAFGSHMWEPARAYRVRVQETCEDGPEAVAAWISECVDVLCVRGRDIYVREKK